jgi:hypothetical protein
MYHWLLPESSVKLSKGGSNREAPMRNRNAAFFAAGGFAAALFLAGAAHAITDTVFQYSTPKTGYLSIPAAAFGVQTDSTPFFNEGGYARSNSPNYVVFVAPVNLPNGTSMERVTFFYGPKSGNTIFVNVLRQKWSDGSTESLAFKTFNNTSGLRTAANVPISDAAKAPINNGQYNYYITINISTTEDFIFGSRITYTYTNAGD